MSNRPVPVLSSPNARTQFGLVILSILLLGVTAGCDIQISDGYVFNYQGVTAENSESGDIPPTIRNIKIINQFGKVDIATTETSDSASWKWDSKVWADDQEMADLLAKETVIEIEEKDDTRTYTLLMPEREFLNGLKSNFVFSIPKDLMIDLTNSHGDVTIQGVQTSKSKVTFGDVKLTDFNDANLRVGHGDALVKNGSGSAEIDASHSTVVISSIESDLTFDGSHSKLSVTDVRGKLSAKTSFDDMILANIKGDADLKNSHGAIQAVVEGNINADNSFGNTDIVCHGESVIGKNSHGELRISVMNPSFKKIDLKTSFDDIELMLPASASPSIDMKTKFGTANSDIASGTGSSNQKVKLVNSHGDIDVRILK